MRTIYIRKNTPLPPYVPLPKFILRAELSLNAKLLYGLLLNRSMLSQKNNWADKNGNIFVIYTISQMAEDLDRSERTVKNALNELENAGLIQRVRQGFQQANRIFVLLPEAAPQEGKLYPIEGQKTAPATGQNLPGSKTEEYNDLSQNERVEYPRFGRYQNVILSPEQLENLQQEFPDRFDTYLEKLSVYMKQSGKQYASHEAVIRKWIAEDSKTKAAWDEAYGEGECL